MGIWWTQTWCSKMSAHLFEAWASALVPHSQAMWGNVSWYESFILLSHLPVRPHPQSGGVCPWLPSVCHCPSLQRNQKLKAESFMSSAMETSSMLFVALAYFRENSMHEEGSWKDTGQKEILPSPFFFPTMIFFFFVFYNFAFHFNTVVRGGSGGYFKTKARRKQESDQGNKKADGRMIFEYSPGPVKSALTMRCWCGPTEKNQNKQKKQPRTLQSQSESSVDCECRLELKDVLATLSLSLSQNLPRNAKPPLSSPDLILCHKLSITHSHLFHSSLD